MRVRVLYFANFRDQAGGKEEEVELPEGATVSTLLSKIEQLHPAL